MSHKNSDFKKAKDAKSTIKYLGKSLKGNYGFILASIIFAVLSSILTVFSPKILGDITTIATTSLAESGNIDWLSIQRSANVLIAIYLVSSVLSYFQNYLMGVMTARYTKNLRKQILEKISRLPISYFDKHQYGDTLSIMSNDVDIIANNFNSELIEIVTSITSIIGILAMMLLVSYELSLVALVSVPISIFFVGKIAKRAQKYFVGSRKTLGKLNSHIEEDYSGHLIIKSNAHESASLEEFKKINNKLYEESWKSSFLGRLAFPIVHVITNLDYTVVCIFGAYLAISGRINIGSVQAFIQYTNQFNRPISNISDIVSNIQLTLAAAERIFNFLAEPEESKDKKDAKEIVDLKGAVDFENVNFHYTEDKPIIKNFSAHIKPGSQVAIVGPTGAGKTTIINLLMRFYDSVSGDIKIDGVSTREMSRSSVRNVFGMVLQDTWLFSGTIAENLKYGNKNATLEDIKSAAKSANIDHLIESFDKGYDTVISEDSDNISAGEKQLLTIARAIVRNPEMIILDEATSNVDTRTEKLIQDALEKLTRGRTSFVIAHRLSTIVNSDLILVMKDGNIIEQGNHASLLKQNGFYAELYNSQFTEN